MTRARILVIDDDPLFRSLLTSMLRKDFEVIVASDGAEGYYRALELPPQLAVVDIRMSGWDGLKTLKAFRAHHLLAGVPVMMLTSDASRQTVMASLEAGANDYVIKTTLSRDEFVKKVCRQLGLEPEVEDAAGAVDFNGEAVANAPVEMGKTNPVAVADRIGGRSTRDADAFQAVENGS